MSSVDKLLNIVENLQPNFSEYADNSEFYYWMDYACELDNISNIIYGKKDSLVKHLQDNINRLSSTSAEHHACVDVATSIEECYDEYKGAFKYE